MKILFLGSGAFGIPSLEALAVSGHSIVGIVTQPDRPAGRGKHLAETPIAQAAGAYGWPVIKPDHVNAPDVIAQLAALQPDCLVVIAFGQKLSDEILRLAPHGGINLHSSLLPKYRGAAPINWAVLNHDPIAGVCVIEVTHVMDGGAVLASASTPIGPAETAGELHDRLALLGAPLLPRVLDQLAEGQVTRTPQDKAFISKAPKLSRDLAWVDFTQPAELASARIRGLSPWPGVQVELTDPTGKPRTNVTLLKCQAIGTSTHTLEQCGTVLADRTVACACGTLQLLTVQPAGKKPMDLQAFANGYGYAPGAKLRSLILPPACP